MMNILSANFSIIANQLYMAKTIKLSLQNRLRTQTSFLLCRLNTENLAHTDRQSLNTAVTIFHANTEMRCFNGIIYLKIETKSTELH